MTEKGPVGKYNKIASELALRSQLQKSADQIARCTCWVEGTTEPLRTRVMEFIAQQGLVVLEGEFQAPLDTKVTLGIFLKNSAVLCCRGWVVPLSDGLCGILPDPDEAYEVQRRHEARIPILGGYELLLEWVDRKTKKEIKARVTDLSAHGVSFLVPENFVEQLSPTIDKALLRLRQRPIHLTLKVENTQDDGRVGGSIAKISESDAQFLSDFVGEQTVLNLLPGTGRKVRSK